MQVGDAYPLVFGLIPRPDLSLARLTLPAAADPNRVHFPNISGVRQSLEFSKVIIAPVKQPPTWTIHDVYRKRWLGVGI
jgi:hypothetical protein